MRFSPLFVVAFAFVVSACGDDDAGSALLSGAVTGSFEGKAFTVKTGVFGITSGGTNVVVMGTDNISCGSITAPNPPDGTFASFPVTEVAPGTYGNVIVTVDTSDGGFHGAGSSKGTLVIDSVDDTSLAGSIAYTDTVENKVYAVNGSFEVARCK